MKKLLLILLCLPLIGFGQTWEKNCMPISSSSSVYGMGNSVQQTNDGGFIITGRTNIGNGASFLLKTNGNGVEEWNIIMAPMIVGEGNSVQQTTDGGYIICGSEYINAYENIFLKKVDANGNLLWSKNFGGPYDDRGNSVQQTTDGGYIITGNRGSDIYLIKTNGNGDSLWTKTFGDQFNVYDWGYSIQQTIDGGYIICSKGETHNYLIKTDENGIEQWSQNLFGGRSVQQTNDGGYIITGGSKSLIKTDENGDSLWTKTFGVTGDEIGYSVQQTSDGGYIVTGHTYSSAGNLYDIYLRKTDGNGQEQWNQTFGDTLYDFGRSVQQTVDGGYIISGGRNVSSYGECLFLMKTDGNGNITSTFNIPINPNRKLKKTVDMLGRETKQTNQPLIYIYDDGTVEKIIVIE